MGTETLNIFSEKKDVCTETLNNFTEKKICVLKH